MSHLCCCCYNCVLLVAFRMAFKENMDPLMQCFNFSAPLYDDTQVIVYTIVNDTSGGKYW